MLPDGKPHRVQEDLKIGSKLKQCFKLWGPKCAHLLDNYPHSQSSLV